MMQYVTTSRALTEAFEHVKFKKIPREDNTKADILAKLDARANRMDKDQPIIDVEIPNVLKQMSK